MSRLASLRTILGERKIRVGVVGGGGVIPRTDRRRDDITEWQVESLLASSKARLKTWQLWVFCWKKLKLCFQIPNILFRNQDYLKFCKLLYVLYDSVGTKVRTTEQLLQGGGAFLIVTVLCPKVCVEIVATVLLTVFEQDLTCTIWDKLACAQFREFAPVTSQNISEIGLYLRPCWVRMEIGDSVEGHNRQFQQSNAICNVSLEMLRCNVKLPILMFECYLSQPLKRTR